MLTGEGKHFTAGLDLTDVNLTEFDEKDGMRDAARKGIIIHNLISHWQKCFSAIEEIGVPVLVGVHSACIGIAFLK